MGHLQTATCLACAGLAFAAGCSDSIAPVIPPSIVPDTLPARPADPVCPPSTPERRFIPFWGRCWEVRYAPQAQAPGANVYSNDPRDVWVDEAGRLHLRVAHRNGQWLCTELSTPGVGYGTYVFYVSGQVDRMDPNVVLGLFTWDPKLFETGAWDEIDIELTRWGKGFWNLQYSVQPLYGPDSPDGRYAERSASSLFSLAEPRSTYVMTWSPNAVRFESYQGFGRDPSRLLASWEFTAAQPARRANDTTLATPVGIPPATPSMELHLDLWLNDTNKDGFGDPPMNGMETEVVVDAVEFIPAGT